MITKAIIVEKKDNLYRVRIPLLHGAENSANSTANNDLPFASVCLSVNCLNPFNIGDIVFVSFEENDSSKPVILGFLYIEQEENNIDSTQDLFIRNIKVLAKAHLPNGTMIADAKNINFEHLTNTDENIHEQLKEIKARLAELENK